ncbi:MAG: hypothetical protein IKU10_06745 [Clostridia bacterium]|nr:hypothetical protein [Clostridia bacterium]
MKRLAAIPLTIVMILTFIPTMVGADQSAVQTAIEKINAIGTVNTYSRVAIEQARSAYNGLTDEEKAWVTNLSVSEVLEETASVYPRSPKFFWGEHFLFLLVDETAITPFGVYGDSFFILLAEQCQKNLRFFKIALQLAKKSIFKIGKVLEKQNYLWYVYCENNG